MQGYLEWLPFVFCFLPSFHAVIDFLSIRKVIISPRSLPMIVTPYGHVLYTKMLQIARRFVSAIIIARGVLYGKPTAHAHVMMFDALPVGRTAKKIMESLRTFVFVETVLRRGRMFQGSDEV